MRPLMPFRKVRRHTFRSPRAVSVPATSPAPRPEDQAEQREEQEEAKQRDETLQEAKPETTVAKTTSPAPHAVTLRRHKAKTARPTPKRHDAARVRILTNSRSHRVALRNPVSRPGPEGSKTDSRQGADCHQYDHNC